MNEYKFLEKLVFLTPTIAVNIEEHSFRVVFVWLRFAFCWEYKDEEETDNNGNE